MTLKNIAISLIILGGSIAIGVHRNFEAFDENSADDRWIC